MPRNEFELTMKELHSKETAGILGTDKTIEKIKSRDVRKFIQECFDCQKVKPSKVYCKPKFYQSFLMKTQTALEVAEICLEYCLTFGIPEAVLTDQGSNFTSQVIECLWERLDAHTLRALAY